ncbi:MAG TPA: carboxypeptidase regulatory-like domain-containing protein [Pantanalinema sp.]
MSHQTTRNILLLLGGMLLCGGCDARDGTLYQSLGALNGGPGATGASNALDVHATVTPSQDARPSDHVDATVELTRETGPGGFTVRLATGTSTQPGLPPGAAFVRLTVSAPDMQAPLVTFLNHSATQSAAVASLSVPLGDERTLSVAVKDETGKVLARGGRERLRVEAGRFAAIDVPLSTLLGDLYGQVLNGMTLTPEPGVTVTLGDTQSVTDRYGVYRLEGVAPGAQTLSFEKAQFARATRSVDVQAGFQTDPETQRLDPL